MLVLLGATAPIAFRLEENRQLNQDTDSCADSHSRTEVFSEAIEGTPKRRLCRQDHPSSWHLLYICHFCTLSPSIDTRSFLPRKKKRRAEGPGGTVRVAPLLQPFVAQAASKLSGPSASLASAPITAAAGEEEEEEICGPHVGGSEAGGSGTGGVGGVDTYSVISHGIYEFLSPNLVTKDEHQFSRVLSTNDLPALIKREVDGAGAGVVAGVGLRSLEHMQRSASLPNLSLQSAADIIERERATIGRLPDSAPLVSIKKLLQSIQPPDWYQKGEHVGALLREAESLDWETDEVAPGVPVFPAQCFPLPPPSCSPSPPCATGCEPVSPLATGLRKCHSSDARSTLTMGGKR